MLDGMCGWQYVWLVVCVMCGMCGWLYVWLEVWVVHDM